MASRGICDRVAIVGMGCTPFGEHWSKSADDLLIDAAGDAVAAAGIGIADVDAFWNEVIVTATRTSPCA